MAQGDGAALGVHLLHGDLEVVHGHRRLRGEGLIDLEDVNIVDFQVGLLQGGRDREGRTNAHDVGVHTDDREAAEAANDREAHSLGHVAAREQDQRGAVRDLAGVACSGAAIRLEGRLQLAQALQHGVTARALVSSDSHLRDLALLVLDGRGHRHDLGVKELLLLRRHGLLVRVHRQLVLRLTRDVPLGRHVLRGDAHGDQACSRHFVVANLRGHLLHVHTSAHGVH
mmetsp:Transcript_17231/g.44330  ORF Transcript_17231/g.44330 Transcript_17231/m.44330 type:complete len:227 (+) Transcript_17231:293-973(+)